MSEDFIPKLSGIIFLPFLKKLQIDIACLKETNLLMPEVDKLNALGWKVVAVAPFTSKARGMVILVKSVLAPVLHATIIDPQGRYVI